MRLFILFVFLFTATSALFAEVPEKQQAFLSSHFHWKHQSRDIYKILRKKGNFEVQKNQFLITGDPKLKDFAEKFLPFLEKAKKYLADEYQLTSGKENFWIPLISEENAKNLNFNIQVEAKRPFQLNFPLVVSLKEKPDDVLKSFAMFNLLHAVLRAELAFGNDKRLPFSSHAYRFVDGMAGFLALEVFQNVLSAPTKPYLKNLQIKHAKEVVSRKYSSQQILAQNKGNTKSAFYSDFYQFLAGLNLSKNSESAIQKFRKDSSAKSIEVFSAIGKDKIKVLIKGLSENGWRVNAGKDSFCEKFVQVNCNKPFIDGTRADILLVKKTKKNFAKWLEGTEKNQPKKRISGESDLPAYADYGFDFPRVGGANEVTFDLGVRGDSLKIHSEQMLDDELIQTTGISLKIGFQDESNKMMIHTFYSFGQKESDEEMTISSTTYQVPRTITHNEMLIGTRVIKRGFQSNWVNETGIYFYWNRVQLEWDTRNITGSTQDTEYIHRSFIMANWQNYNAWKVGGFLDIGLNTDFMIGGVNHSGSVALIKDEKFNKDTSHFSMGTNIGPEIRITLPYLQIRIGGSIEYLWQPFNNEGGNSSTSDNEINATQRSQKAYATIEIQL
ncbi:MAG: hypothetical protein ACI86H_001391 [bacterium]|jgi:hypothetical protein